MPLAPRLGAWVPPHTLFHPNAPPNKTVTKQAHGCWQGCGRQRKKVLVGKKKRNFRQKRKSCVTYAKEKVFYAYFRNGATLPPPPPQLWRSSRII